MIIRVCVANKPPWEHNPDPDLARHGPAELLAAGGQELAALHNVLAEVAKPDLRRHKFHLEIAQQINMMGPPAI